MEKYKKLAKNIGILTIGQFGSKILVFLLVPLYTSVLTTEEYGTYDFVYTTINLLFPILSLNIAVSVQRFLLEKNNNKEKTIGIGFKYTIIGIAIIGVVLLTNRILGLSDNIIKNDLWFFLLYISLSVNTLMVESAIGSDNVKAVSISGIISTLIMISFNILLLLVVRLGLSGYFIANIAGLSVQSIYLLVKQRENLSLCNYTSKKLEKEMLSYSKPQIANTIAWWINNASDRYVVTWLCGLSVNGIYSVGYKIPSILNVIQNIFGQAWGISAVKNYNEKDDDGFFTKTYNLYNTGIIISCSLIIVTTKLIAKFMYAKDFYTAWYFVPFLAISSVFGAMAGYLGGIFAAKKEAKLFAKSTIIGAVTNVFLNIILVYFMGAIGAALATMISYCTVWVFRLIHAKKYINLDVPLIRDIISYILLIVQSIVVMEIKDNIVLYLLEFLLIVIILCLRQNELRLIANKVIHNR